MLFIEVLCIMSISGVETKMYRVLIVDDEKIEREGIRFLLSDEQEKWEIYEASNGKQALQVLREHEIDILFTDVKMPHMDGLELAARAKKENENLKIIIFSGYSDFAFAQEAIRNGVSDYVLKPVDPDHFHETLKKTEAEIASRKTKELKNKKEQDFLQQYFLQNYIYSGRRDILEKAQEMMDLTKWNRWHCAILAETEENFFDADEDHVSDLLQSELRRNFFYLNLNGRQSIFLFQDQYCDYVLVAQQLFLALKRNYSVRVHLAVSRKFDGYENLPAILSELEQEMEEKFYHPDTHVFTSDMDENHAVSEEVQDSRLMQMISEDISRKDTEQLRKHFSCLAQKYREDQKFSAMYTKFVFANVIQELFQESHFAKERTLEKEIDRLYSCNDINQIIEVTEGNIREYEEFLERSAGESRNEVAAVKNYIYHHYSEDLSLEMLAEKVYLSSGYLSFIFKKETGMNLNRYIRVFRMEKAKEILCTTNRKVAQVSEEVGFANVSYFCRSFREYYGSSPESYRKGTGDDEASLSKIE